MSPKTKPKQNRSLLNEFRNATSLKLNTHTHTTWFLTFPASLQTHLWSWRLVNSCRPSFSALRQCRHMAPSVGWEHLPGCLTPALPNWALRMGSPFMWRALALFAWRKAKMIEENPLVPEGLSHGTRTFDPKSRPRSSGPDAKTSCRGGALWGAPAEAVSAALWSSGSSEWQAQLQLLYWGSFSSHSTQNVKPLQRLAKF